ncbi:MAG: hypothetical protein AUG06_03830 [Actinobacteria bacterium 13_1_20CM_2_65_11]|nr:MAG: hypothetical protein AUH40_07925 [Chloroflexi bacterium 13_1_40CM_65_17]OLC64527.1 MAG: hypothetical protein AUH69_11965 [Actinobacteria bacterium 13_1_40CM_4_65_12]OLD25496.1 MAG: hypothetical protein AUJ02_05125 [Chloroflexi bacterium 13_1_40CM_3_65_12]OLE80658.1 MAG: hypothetical protein AUG06_03830 [Actinobacteria bacterium 13_1_20CM_2_65_11]
MTIQLTPNLRVARAVRVAAIAAAVLLVGFGVYLPVSAAAGGQLGRALPGVLLLALWIGTAWFILALSRPPVVKADAMLVTADRPLNHQAMPRSELALIFRGLTVYRGRYTTWVRSYLFVDKDGKVRIVVAAFWFPNEGMTDFAQRLGVPAKGDFTRQVRGRMDLRSV